MSDDNSGLLDILRIGLETSRRGAGLSLRDALSRTHYTYRRSGFGPRELVPLIGSRRELAEGWFAYSEDKRTSGGWYLLRSGEIGRAGDPGSRLRFDTLEEAVATYVVRELDFWAGLPDAG
jgi:hypothetical protein